MIRLNYHICGGDGVELEPAGEFHDENVSELEAVSRDEPGMGGGLAAHPYILRCADGPCYVGTTRGSLVEHSSR
jgi:hypothetical protein